MAVRNASEPAANRERRRSDDRTGGRRPGGDQSIGQRTRPRRRIGPLATELIVAIRDGRRAFGWSQRELGARAAVSQPTVSRIELGLPSALDLAVVERLLVALEIDARLTVRRPVLMDPPGQRDAAHARCSAYVGRRLEALGWTVQPEVEIGGDRIRGWVDLLACEASSGRLLLVEVKTEIRDIGQIERTMAWYEREAWAAARRFGWRARELASVLLLLATESNDSSVRFHRDAFARSFPGRSDGLARWLDHSSVPRPPRSVAMIDPMSRGRTWLKPLRVDGRRSIARFVDYAAFMAGVRSRPRHRRGRSSTTSARRPGG